jgi:hypothetical protein
MGLEMRGIEQVLWRACLPDLYSIIQEMFGQERDEQAITKTHERPDDDIFGLQPLFDVFYLAKSEN